MRTLVPMRDGAQLAVQVVGRGEPVVMLHGFGMRAAHWLPNVLPLAHRYRFVMPDLRGFGESHHVPLNDRDVLANYARDVEDVMDHLGLSRAAMAGISMGACTAMKFFAHGHADRVTRYLNIDQAPKTRNDATWRHGLFGERQDEVFALFRALAERARAHGDGVAYRALPAELRRELNAAFGDFFADALSRGWHQAAARWLARNAEPVMTRVVLPVAHWRTYMTVMEAYLEQDDDLRPGLARVRAPFTVMVGMRSRMYPPPGQLAIAEHVPHATVVRFENSGHVPMIDEPLKFQRSFARFLAG